MSTLVAFPSSPDEPARCPLRGECEPTGAERRIHIEVSQLNIDDPEKNDGKSAIRQQPVVKTCVDVELCTIEMQELLLS